MFHSGHTVSNIRQADEAVQQAVQGHFDLKKERKDKETHRFCPSHVLSRQAEQTDRRAEGTDLSEVLLKVAELQTLLQFQVVFGPELFKRVLCLPQLSQQPGTQGGSVLTLPQAQRSMLTVALTGNQPLHGGLILHLIRTQLVVLRLGCRFSDAAQQSGALLQR